MDYTLRFAAIEDIKAITDIYNQGIEDRIATLETRIRNAEEMKEWLLNREDRHKVIVIEDEDGVQGWASLNPFNSRCCYDGVADFSVYIKRNKRGKGLGKKLLIHLCKVAQEVGFHKLVLSALEDNTSGQRLYEAVGFRTVGTYINQGILDGKWVNITIMEKLLE